MKRQFPSLRPSAADGSLFPAACTALLALLAAVQLGLSAPEPLPTAGPMAGPVAGGAARAALPAMSVSLVDPALRSAPIFDPARSLDVAGASGEGGAARPTWRLAGSMEVRGRRYAVLQSPQGKAVRLPLGGSIAGMRLLSLSADGAVFLSGGKRIAMPFGGSALPEPTPVTGSEETTE